MSASSPKLGADLCVHIYFHMHNNLQVKYFNQRVLFRTAAHFEMTSGITDYPHV